MKDTTRAKPWVSVLIVGVFLVSAPGALFARDRGVNQPRGAGNPAAHPDAGYNQPGTAGNVGRDPGINQSGATGNVGAPGRRAHRLSPSARTTHWMAPRCGRNSIVA